MRLPECDHQGSDTPWEEDPHSGNVFRITYSPKKCKVLQDRGCDDLMNVYASWVHTMNVRT